MDVPGIAGTEPLASNRAGVPSFRGYAVDGGASFPDRVYNACSRVLPGHVAEQVPAYGRLEKQVRRAGPALTAQRSDPVTKPVRTAAHYLRIDHHAAD